MPMTVLGGAGSLDDIGQLISKYGIIGAAAGNMLFNLNFSTLKHIIQYNKEG